jgi:hypothetical protein
LLVAGGLGGQVAQAPVAFGGEILQLLVPGGGGGGRVLRGLQVGLEPGQLGGGIVALGRGLGTFAFELRGGGAEIGEFGGGSGVVGLGLFGLLPRRGELGAELLLVAGGGRKIRLEFRDLCAGAGGLLGRGFGGSQLLGEVGDLLDGGFSWRVWSLAAALAVSSACLSRA